MRLPTRAITCALAALLLGPAAASAAPKYDITYTFTSVAVHGDGDSGSCGDFYTLKNRANIDGSGTAGASLVPTATIGHAGIDTWYVLCDGNTYKYSGNQSWLDGWVSQNDLLFTSGPFNVVTTRASAGASPVLRLTFWEMDPLSTGPQGNLGAPLKVPGPGGTLKYNIDHKLGGVHLTTAVTVTTGTQPF